MGSTLFVVSVFAEKRTDALSQNSKKRNRTRNAQDVNFSSTNEKLGPIIFNDVCGRLKGVKEPRYGYFFAVHYHDDTPLIPF